MDPLTQEVMCWPGLWAQELDRYVSRVNSRAEFDTPGWYDERPQMGFLLQALTRKYGEDVLALVEHRSSNGTLPDLWLTLKAHTPDVWIEAKCYEAAWSDSKKWGGAWQGGVIKQRAHAFKQSSQSDFRAGDLRIRFHFILAPIPQITWPDWSTEFDAHISALHDVARQWGAVHTWIDKRLRAGLPHHYPPTTEVYPCICLVTDVLSKHSAEG
jgi:hypothetical protein